MKGWLGREDYGVTRREIINTELGLRLRHRERLPWYHRRWDALIFLVYLQDYIAGRSIIDAHFGRHHHHVILSDVEARRAQAVSAKQKFKKVFCISPPVCRALGISCELHCCSFVRLPASLLAYSRILSFFLSSLSLSFSLFRPVSLLA